MQFDPKTRVHTVYYVSEDDAGKETVEAQVLVADDSGQITEVRTGPQVAWSMARGYPGAFGRALTRPIIWIPLCVLFLVPLLPLTRPRRLISWRTLDLLALLSFSISLIWFDRGEIFTSVPLQYPPMVYLAVRLAWMAIARARAARPRPARRWPRPPRTGPPRRPPRPPRPPGGGRPSAAGRRPGCWSTLLVVTLALRFGLNAFDSNVIDVGYAGVIGADRITHGETPYGTMPSDCSTCDTYGPLTYITYVPFELAEPWHGTWDELNAAHGAATMFDVLCLAGMFALGWSISGLRLGMGLALAWAAFPFTAFALETNSNDSLVAAALIWGLVLFRHPLGRGADARLRPGEQVRARRAAAAVEPQAVPARRRGLARGGRLRRRAGARRRPDRLGAAARRRRRPARPSGRARSATSSTATRPSRSGASTTACARCRSA